MNKSIMKGVLTIDKPFAVPQDLQALEALDRRVLPNHPSKLVVAGDLKKISSGNLGEQKVYFHLKHLPRGQYRVFHNLRLKERNSTFQIDFLVLSLNFILINEVKTYKGNVYFNEFDQLIRVQETGQEEILDENPVSQVTRHSIQFQNWLDQQNLPQIPIVPLVVFSFPNTIIQNRSQNKDLYKIVISGSNILPKIKQLNREYSKSVYTQRLINKLSLLLLESDIPLERNLFDYYKVKPSDLIKGVLCPNCRYTKMDYYYGKWTCPKCGENGNHEFIRAINDFKLLFGNEISIRQAKKFLDIDSPDAIRYLFKKLGFKGVGNTTARKYLLE